MIPLYFSQIFLGEMRGDSPVRGGRYDLAQGFCADISHGIYPREACPGGFVGQYISGGIQLQLILYKLGFRLSANADKYPVTGKDHFFSRSNIAHGYPLKSLVPLDP